MKTSKKIFFIKAHALGNDFVFICKNELKKIFFDEEIKKKRDLILQLSDRHIGIGCDQLVIYEYLNDGYFNIMLYNQDGSKAKACGNAYRCMMQIAYEEFNLEEITLKSLDREIKASINDGINIESFMGKVSWDEDWMIDQEDILIISKRYNINYKNFICADIGNPHLIIFTELDKHLLKEIAHDILNLQLFPKGVNINFAKYDKEKNGLILSVFERGVNDFTLACGSGACCSVASLIEFGLIDVCNSVDVFFDLGKINIEYDSNNKSVIMKGPVKISFKSDYYL